MRGDSAPKARDARGHANERLGLALAVLATALAYSLVGVFKHWHFNSSYDLGIFDQAVWHLSRFETPGSTISGYPNILGDHFYPIVFLFVLPYWIVPAPESLIVTQAVLIALSMVPIYFFLRDRFPASMSFCLVIAYALFWGLQRTINNDVHEMAFAPLVIAGAVLAMDRKRWSWLWISCLVLMCVKEDLIPLVAAIGAYTFWQGDRRQGLLLMAVGLLGFGVIVTLVIPSFSGAWSTGNAYHAVWERPWTAFAVMASPPQKLLTVVYWLAPFCFLSLRSPLTLLIVPIAAERLLSSLSSHWGWGAHYSAPLAPLLAMSAADGLYRLTRGTATGNVGWSGLSATLVALTMILSLLVPGHQPLLRLFKPEHYRIAEGRGVATSALATIPPGASVVAQAGLLPHLSQRQKIYVLDEDAPDADYVIALMTMSPWPLSHQDQLAELIKERQAQRYVTIFNDAGWIVLKAPDARTTATPR